MKNLAQRLGARIKEVRRSRGLTQERLAEKAEISARYLSRLEVGDQSPAIETLARLAEVLDVELWELFDSGHTGTSKALRTSFRKLVREPDDQKLRLAVKVLRAVLR